jgi:two-component system chemotaxis response regulator CheB
MAPDVTGLLPRVLNAAQTIPAAHARDMEPIKSGRIYVAPPDYHLMLQDGHVRVTKGPKENRFRPAIDPLFRSAAYTFGPRVIGVVLSGGLDDGSSGLWTIKQYGGLAVVQDPADAEARSMPENALRAVEVDFKVPASRIAPLLTSLVKEPVPSNKNTIDSEINEQIKHQINTAMEVNTHAKSFEMGDLSPYTCPECHGVLAALKEGGRLRFQCHTGHSFSADALITSVSESIEESIWNAVRSVQENIMLLNHMGDHFAETKQTKLAAVYFKKAQNAKRQVELLREAVLAHEQLSVEKIAQESIGEPVEK